MIPDRIALCGFMGAGKSTVGPLVAAAIGSPFVDVDAEIERAVGSTVGALFETRGEAAFRALEREVVGRALEAPRVVAALGGGAFADDATRALVLERAWTCHLACAFEECLRRASLHGSARPLLADARAARDLFQRREPLYARAHASLDVTALAPGDVASRILASFPPIAGA